MKGSEAICKGNFKEERDSMPTPSLLNDSKKVANADFQMYAENCLPLNKNGMYNTSVNNEKNLHEKLSKWFHILAARSTRKYTRNKTCQG